MSDEVRTGTEESKRRPGRPRRSALPVVATPVYMDIELRQKVDAEVARRGVSRSEWMCEAAREKLDRLRPYGLGK